MKKFQCKNRLRKAIETLTKISLITVLCIVISSKTAFAAGAALITGDKDTAAVGDSYTVTVSVRNDESDSVAPDVSVNYDVNRLSFVSCSGEYGGGAGGFITLGSGDYKIEFTILSGGQADVDVTAIFNGDGNSAQTLTASVFVEGEDTAAPNEMAREDESVSTGVEAGTIAASDGSVISTVIPDEFMPVGFYKTTTSYEEQMVEAAQFEMGSIVLLYITDENTGSGNFKIYDQNTGELKDFLQIPSIENRFIIVMTAEEGVVVPEGFEPATLNWNDKTLQAYTFTGEAKEGSSVNASEFFLMYAMSSEGNLGWYIYDTNEGTYQRFADSIYSAGAKSSSSDEGFLSQITSVGEQGEEGGINILLIIAIALAVLLVALIVIVIIMAVKLKEFNSYEYIDEDEDEDTILTSQNMNMEMNGKRPSFAELAANDEATGAGSAAIAAAMRGDDEEKSEKEKPEENVVKPVVKKPQVIETYDDIEEIEDDADDIEDIEETEDNDEVEDINELEEEIDEETEKEEIKPIKPIIKKDADVEKDDEDIVLAKPVAPKKVATAVMVEKDDEDIKPVKPVGPKKITVPEEDDDETVEAVKRAIKEEEEEARKFVKAKPKTPERPAAPVRPSASKAPVMDDEMPDEMPKSKNIYEKYRMEDEMPDEMPRSKNIYEKYRMEDEMPDEMPKSKNIYEKYRMEDEMPDEMPKSKNIYEQYRREEEIPEEFVVRKRNNNQRMQPMQQEPEMDDMYADEDDMFSPRDRKMSRAEKKAMKQEEKARKKEQKRLKKEYGEFGPVDWQSWQDAVEGGEKTAASASRNAGVDEGAVRRPNPRYEEPVYEEEQFEAPRRPKRRPEPAYEEEQLEAPRRRKRREEPVYEEEQFEEPRRPKRRQEPVYEEEQFEAPRRPKRRQEPVYEEEQFEAPRRPKRRQEPVYEEEQFEAPRRPKRRPEPAYEEEQFEAPRRPKRRGEPVQEDPIYREPKYPQYENPMDMMRGIPANDNKAPVQSKPVQQFDFDDDFEFEFLSLDDED